MRNETTLRIEGDDCTETEVVVEGVWESFSSYNPHESGPRIVDLEVVSPPGFKLTDGQIEQAERQLYDAARDT